MSQRASQTDDPADSGRSVRGQSPGWCGVVRSALAAVLGAGLAGAGTASGDVEHAEELADSGRWDEAVEAFEAAGHGDDEARARLGLARVLLATGRYDEAEELLRSHLDDEEGIDEHRELLGQLLVARGRCEEAIEVLTPAVEGDDTPWPPARYWRGEAYQGLGRRSRARLDFEDTVRDLARGRAGSPRDAEMAARALQRLGRFQESNDMFRDALARSPDSQSARLGWAELFLEKYRPDEASPLVDEVLAVNPTSPEALALKGRCVFELSWDTAQARRFAEQALIWSPGYPPALELLAELAVVWEDFDGALDLLARSNATNPARLETLSIEGAVHYLLDDMESFARVEGRVLDIDSQYAAFYHTVGEFAVNTFRYSESIELEERALAIDAGFHPSWVALGIGWSRLGDDARAIEFLRRAFDADPFNAQAFYMANLWEQTLTSYRFIEDPEREGLRYRFNGTEADVLSRYYPSRVRATLDTYDARYGTHPEMPLSVEVFSDAETFGIRTLGVPSIDLHGVCFGHVVTSRSPIDGNFSWAQVIEHELSHVYSLQVSRYRVPKWFTEGLAEYDTIQTTPRWRREEDFALARAVRENRLVGVSGLSMAFAAPSVDQIVAAYYQASLVVEYIAERWGRDALVEMLSAYGRSLRTEAVVREVLGVPVEELDAAFAEWLGDRIGPLLPLFEPSLSAYGDLPALEAAAAAQPGDADAIAALGCGRLLSGDAMGATELLARAIALDPRQPLAHWALAGMAVAGEQWAEAESQARALLASGVESWSAHLWLGILARRDGRMDEAVTELTRATTLYPRGAEAWRELADIHLRAGSQAPGLEALERVVQLDEHDFDSAFRLAGLLHDVGRLADALAAARAASEINPFHRDLHGLFGRIAVANAEWETAARELEMELQLGPEDRAGTLRLLGRTYEALGRAEDAARVLREAGPLP